MRLGENTVISAKFKMQNVKLRKILIFFIILAFLPVLSPEVLKASAIPGILIVRIKEGSDPRWLSVYSREAELIFDQVYRLRVKDKQSAIIDLKTQPWVEYVGEDGIIRTQLNAADPLFVLDQQELTKQWYLPKIQTHLAWNTTTGAGITVAVVDTGIDGKHEDLSDGRVVGGYLSYCQVSNQANPTDCLMRASGELAPGVNSDDNGHGTIVAGIIGANTNNNKGIAGINWNVRLMPIKVLDSSGSGLASDVALGIKWAADHGAKVINLSIGGSGLQGAEILQDAISYAFKKGRLVVAAAGNDAAVIGGNLNTNPILPICADGGENMVVGVAAVDIADHKARFSNYGSNCIDIAAPGTGTFVDKQQKQGLVSTYYDPSRPGEHDLYVYAVGTSVAAPMVSGVAALMMSAMSDLDSRAIRDRLIKSIDNIDKANETGCNGGSCVGQIGRGRLNALKALTTQSTFSSGTFIKGPDGSLYLIEKGLKRPISEFVFRQGFLGSPVVAATFDQLNTLPTGLAVPPADGSTIKEPVSPLVYLVEGGERRSLSYLAFISRGLQFSEVVSLSAAEIASYPLGSEAPVLDGILMKSADHPAVYILNKGVRQLLSFFVFMQRGLNNKPTAVLSLEELARYQIHPQGYLFPPPDGTLIRGDQEATVYIFENGVLRGMNLAAFQNRGFQFAQVKVLPQSEVEGYEKGSDIIE